LRGPFRGVEGAQVEAQTPETAREQLLRVRAREAFVTFGAIGHQWHRVPAAALVEGARFELPEAAPALVVRVREQDGSPAAGVPVRVEPAPPGPAPETDEGGTLVLDYLAPGLTLLDCHSDMRRGPQVRVHAGRDETVELVLEPVWRVRGRVVDPRGVPVPAARVEAFGPAGSLGTVTATDDRGQFTWRGPAVARVAIVVRAAGWGEERFAATPPALGALQSDLGDLALRSAGVTLTGKVNAAWRGADAHITVAPRVAAPQREVVGEGPLLAGPRRVPRGADGRFTVHDLPADLPLRVAARGAGVPVDAVVEGAAGAEVEVLLEPPAGEKLVGVLQDVDGTPAAGVRLLLSPAARDGDLAGPGDEVVLTGADGSFMRRGLVGRVWYLRAFAPGRRSLHRRVVVPLAEPLALQFELALTDAQRRIHGRVFDGIRTEVTTKDDDAWVGQSSQIEYRAPLAGVAVRAGGVRVLTDEEGRFALDGVESLAPSVGLAYGFEPGHEGGVDPRTYLASEVLEVTPGGEALELVLWKSASLRFRALDALDDSPLSFVHVVLRTDEGRTVFDRGVATRDGFVEITGVPPRGSELTVVTTGRRFRKAPLQLRPGQALDLGDVLLVEGMRIAGRVLGPGGQPIPGARIGAYGKGWQHAEADPGQDRALLFRTAETDINGRFTVRGFDPRKPADLAIWARGFAPTAVRIELPKFSDVIDADVEVKLVPGAFLVLDLHATGTQRDTGERIRGAFVDIEHAHDGTDWLDLLHRGLLRGPCASSADWRAISEQLLYERRGVESYVIGPVRPAPYTLWVERPGFERLRSKMTVIDPKETILLDLARGGERQFGGRVTRLLYELSRAR
ncbi:MAG: carboxypeptidase regulatory-like domain-containing protein, partial [Planctomycetota bacterium]|nr:carboxypeptidase regulatory-like domain-containing protein [Planctomycetota bacterium]